MTRRRSYKSELPRRRKSSKLPCRRKSSKSPRRNQASSKRYRGGKTVKDIEEADLDASRNILVRTDVLKKLHDSKTIKEHNIQELDRVSYKYVNGELSLKKGNKGRLPGYADRVFVTNSFQATSKPHYDTYEGTPTSDHYPVISNWHLNENHWKIVTYNAGNTFDLDFAHFLNKSTHRRIILTLQELDATTYEQYKEALPSFRSVKGCSSIPVGQVGTFWQAIFVKHQNPTPTGEGSTETPPRLVVIEDCMTTNPHENITLFESWYQWFKDKFLTKGMVVAKYDDDIIVISVHFPFDTKETLQEYMSVLIKYVKSIGDKPVVIAGDFNSRSLLDCYKYAKNVDITKCDAGAKIRV